MQRKSIDTEKLDQQPNSDEDELYLDCLEKFIDDQTNYEIDNNQINKRLIYRIGNELDTLKEEGDNLERSNKVCDHQNEIRKQDETKAEKELLKLDEEKLRVKVEGSNEIEKMDNCLNKQKNDKHNNDSEQNWAVHQEQVLIEKFEKIVKPNKQGNQVRVSLTQSTICSVTDNNYSNNSLKSNDTLKDNLKVCLKESKFKENDLNETSLKVQQQCASSRKAKSINSFNLKSESPSIHFEQKVSVVKHTFENKVKMMNSINLLDKKSDNDKNNGKQTSGVQLKKLDQINEIESKIKQKKSNDDSKATESKIAREIRELKEREDELKKMRLERLNKELGKDKNLEEKNNELNLVNCKINCLSNNNNCQKSYSSSSNSSSSSSNSNSSSADSTISLNRSDSPPVSNDQCATSIDSLDEGFAEFKSPVSPNSTKNQSLDQLASSNQDSSIQKILATTRIQQEIEEQIRRELALKSIGSIKTTSQERTDKLMMSNLGNSLASALSPTLSLSSLASSLSSLNINSQSNSINNQTTNDLITSSTPVANNNQNTNNNSDSNLNLNQTKLKANYQSNSSNAKTKIYTKNQTALSKQRTFSTSNLTNLHNSINLFKINQSGKHISMAKFIATKGKSAIVDYSSSLNQFNNIGHSDLSYSYTDLLRPPKIDPITAFKKCIQSADYKISTELKDLHEREQELR